MRSLLHLLMLLLPREHLAAPHISTRVVKVQPFLLHVQEASTLVHRLHHITGYSLLYSNPRPPTRLLPVSRGLLMVCHPQAQEPLLLMFNTALLPLVDKSHLEQPLHQLGQMLHNMPHLLRDLTHGQLPLPLDLTLHHRYSNSQGRNQEIECLRKLLQVLSEVVPLLDKPLPRPNPEPQKVPLHQNIVRLLKELAVNIANTLFVQPLEIAVTSLMS